jgi:hypothetical protein
MNEPQPSPSPDDRAEMRRRFEARKLTADGPIWPVRRAEMRHPATIRERMAEDIEALGGGTLIDRRVKTAGWTNEQLADHFAAAFDLYRQSLT